MAKSYHLSVSFLVSYWAALCSETEISYKSVCVGESVEVFQNIASPYFKKTISLYKTSADRDDLIAVWFVQNSSKDDASIRETYKAKLLFENETILIRNFLSTDEATYMILYEIDGLSRRYKVQIYALAPPTEPCELKIEHKTNFLIASLGHPEYCGKPVASVGWKDYPGISRKSKNILELPPGKEAGTYYACFEGDAIKCVKNSTDWKNCKNFTIGSTGGSNSPTPSPDIPQLTTISHLVVGIFVIVAVVLFIVIAILIMKLWQRFGKLSKDFIPIQGQDPQALQLQDVNVDGQMDEDDEDL